MSIEVVKTNKAPEAIGPYSQAIVTGSFVYTSGQIPINPKREKWLTEESKNRQSRCLKI